MGQYSLRFELIGQCRVCWSRCGSPGAAADRVVTPRSTLAASPR